MGSAANIARVEAAVVAAADEAVVADTVAPKAVAAIRRAVVSVHARMTLLIIRGVDR
jgi:hypothetical protein